MIRGIRYQDGMDIRQLEDAGFGLVEYVFGKEPGAQEQERQEPARLNLETPGAVGGLCGLSIPLTAVEGGMLTQAIDRASELKASYLVIETVGANDGTALYCNLGRCLEIIKSSGIKVFIENGYNCEDNSGCSRITGNAYSEVTFLTETIDRLNREAGADCFGVCLNTGRGNLLGKNLCGMIECLGHRIGLLHAGDNDGRTSQCQMPYTFTRGRGELSTDWYGIIGALARCGFKGPLVYDIAGLFEVSPACLRPDWYRLLASVAREWEGILELEEYLKETTKKDRPKMDSDSAGKAGGLVLFGAGRMFHNYMEVWGDAYPPSFIVDNNETLWGGTRENIGIRPPSALLEDKEHPPFVLICNMYHVSIEKQLEAMGIRWQRYDDKYFFRYQNLVGKQGAGVC